MKKAIRKNRLFSDEDVDRIATTTNHVAEDMGRLCTRKELYEAVRYWSLEASYRSAEVQSVKTGLLVYALEVNVDKKRKAKSIGTPRRLKRQTRKTKSASPAYCSG